MSKPNKNGFTLIELLLGITLSAILMTGIVVFVGSSLSSSIRTKQVLGDINKNDKFEQRLTTVLNNITENGVYASGASFTNKYLTGIFLSTGGPNLPITFLGLVTHTGYCDSYSGTANETGSVMLLSLRQFAVPSIQNTPPYIISTHDNVIYSGTTLTGTRIIGTGISGSNLDDSSGSLTELSYPSALAISGTYLYVADTMNNRVLSYDITSGHITTLLGPENNILQPTSLYFSGNTLLVASSGNGTIYSIQDGDGDGSHFSSTFKVASDFKANKIRYTFPDIPSITSPNIALNFTFSGGGISQNPSNDIVNTGASLEYTFSGGLATFSTGDVYQFAINNILPIPAPSGNHILTIDFMSGNTLQYSDVFHYFSKGDNSIESNTGNIINTLSGGFTYPHNIAGAMNWSGSINWNTLLSQDPPGDEILSYLPIQDLRFQQSGRVLTIKYHQYSIYDCQLGKHQIEEKVQKILLP